MQSYSILLRFHHTLLSFMSGLADSKTFLEFIKMYLSSSRLWLIIFSIANIIHWVQGYSTAAKNESYSYGGLSRDLEIVYESMPPHEDFTVSGNTSDLTSLSPYYNRTTTLVVPRVDFDNTTLGHTPLNDHGQMVKPKTYSVLFAAVAATLSAIIFIFGLLGNILVVIVIARTRSMHTTTNCYLLSLAVADSLVLLSGTLPAIPEPFYRVDEWPYGRIMCPTLIFLQYLGVDSSSLSITAFTIERYIAICHPMKAHTMCTVSRAKKIIAILWIFTLLYCAPWLGLTEIKESIYVNNETMAMCHFRFARSSYLVLYMIDLILFYVIPLIIATVLYLLIGRILYLSRALRKNDRVPKRRSPKRRADSRVQVVRMLVVVVAAFASLWMPYRVMVVYNSFAKSAYIDLWFLLFARTMIYVNCAINPVLYNIMSVKFKRAFRNLLICCHRHESLPGNNFSDVATDVWATRRQTVSLQHQQLNQVLQQHPHHHHHHNHYSANNGSKRNPYDNLLAQISTSNVSGPISQGLEFGPAGQYQHQRMFHQQSQDTGSGSRLHRLHSSRSMDTAEQSV